jgi:hypothetical protein
MKTLLAVMLVAGLAFSFAACEKKEVKPLLPPGHPSMGDRMPSNAGRSDAPSTPAKVRAVVISKEVAAKWKAVKFEVENKTAKTRTELTVSIGSERAVPNTKLTVKVLAFLPDFRMTDKEFYSSSNEPNQPAAQVVITENGKEIWSNWLFSLQPTIHPFQHEQVGILLVGWVSK